MHTYERRHTAVGCPYGPNSLRDGRSQGVKAAATPVPLRPSSRLCGDGDRFSTMRDCNTIDLLIARALYRCRDREMADIAF